MVVPETDACAELVQLLERLAGEQLPPRRFLASTGRFAAGIRPGFAGLVDLARGGRNMIAGRGFQPRFDDATSGQVRHFVGIACAAGILGPRLTRWLSERVGRDHRTSADGRLSEAAIEFATRLLNGALPVAAAPGWVRTVVCGEPERFSITAGEATGRPRCCWMNRNTCPPT